MGFLGDFGNAAASAAGGAAITAPLDFVGNLLSSAIGKDNMKEQWDEYYSPKAQVRNLAEAGINPAVAFGNNAPVMNGAGDFSIPQSPLGGIGTESLNAISNYLLAKSQAKKNKVETEGTELDNIVKSKTQEDRIKEVAIRNKFTQEETIKVIQEYSHLIGQINLLQKENEIKQIDLDKHSKLVDSLIGTYVSKANLDEESAKNIREQLPIILDKLKNESDILSVDADIARTFKSTMSGLGVVGQVLGIIGKLVQILK